MSDEWPPIKSKLRPARACTSSILNLALYSLMNFVYVLQVAEKPKEDVKKPRWWEQWKKAVEVDDTMVSVDGAARSIA